MSRLIALNKPFGVLCQFTTGDDIPTLADYVPVKNVYAAGRLDKDSEGLLMLTDDGALQNRIASPKHKLEKTYWVQVDGVPSDAKLQQLSRGVLLKDGKTRPAQAIRMEQPETLWERIPPIRQRNNDITSWIALTLTEGKNRQVRRMTAAVGHPTLRLIRARIGDWSLDGLNVGEWRDEQPPRIKR